MAREGRRYTRWSVEVDLDWSIQTQRLSGKAKLVDVSLLGASFVIHRFLSVERSVVFQLRTPDIPALPLSARLRWFRRLSIYPPALLVGVIFDGAVSPEWSEWAARLAVEDDQSPEEIYQSTATVAD
jgi:hypothetical protein